MEKRRPVVIISPDFRNQSANDIVVLPTSTTLRRMQWHVLLRKGEGGLPADSMVKCESIMTVWKGFVDAEELGVLSAARMREVELALLSTLGIDD